MAKKTRKEKKLADLSRQARLKNNSISREPIPTFQANRQENTHYVKADLAKSIILALFVLAFQLVLYWQLK
jgi:hypothetical protein